ncbi:hypothetical protein NXS19_004985 [Fusarium pseudograminearum]|uniref:Uncharacterized protein n=1 Tax=Fusarium pseudograminearum (strain CS3096) TaxID=1028729 RepID=K3V9E0_FUSPC|nr:hypothetical protein FPSE_09484 [Fusarium pseudograminearum CS3096]EKJ70267.1 hypothetical protein FPSE_09484 [Fusarium pseudograminearum CS3096]KAF0637035.1 hypothetical protein FPSE5266_09484 [Fusarium pseudograminearum]UZP37169.1 hypothetical protein NXS19_004985 [Fusarium pseudograminearum]
MSPSTSFPHEYYYSSGNTTGDQTLAMGATIPASFKSRHHLKQTHEKILTNIKCKREEFGVMDAKDIRSSTEVLDETQRKSRVAVEKMTDAITLYYDDHERYLRQRRQQAYDALAELEGHEYKLKHFLVTVRYGVGPRVWLMNQRKDAKIQQLQDAVDKLRMSCFMARLTDGGREPNNIFAFV